MTGPKANLSVEDAINEITSRLDEVGDEGVQYTGGESGASEYLMDRSKNVETWDGDNS